MEIIDKEVSIPSKRIDAEGNERDMNSPYEVGGYYCTLGLQISDNPYSQHDTFNYRRFRDGYFARRNNG